FFFSSRRRHTRCYRDWSSDVCSSDLSRWRNTTRFWRWRRSRGSRKNSSAHPSLGKIVARVVAPEDRLPCAAETSKARIDHTEIRSEERRVGKECEKVE